MSYRPPPGDGAQLPPAVKCLEHHAGVVRQSADDAGIEQQPVGDAVRFAQRKELCELPHGLGIVPEDLGDVVDGVVGQHGSQLFDHPAAQSQLLQIGLDGVEGQLLQFVHQNASGGKLFFWNTQFRQYFANDQPAVDLDPDVGGGQADAAEERHHGAEQFGLGLHTVDAPHVHVPLVVLPPPPPRHALVPPALRDGVPLERHRQSFRAALGHDHPGQTGGHLRSEGDGPIALVRKGVQLLRDLLPGLARVQGGGFQDRGVVLLEGVLGSDGAPLVEQPRSEAHVGGVEIARPLGRVGVQPLLLLGGRAVAGRVRFLENVLVELGGRDAPSARATASLGEEGR